MFKKITQKVAKQMDPTGDLVPVHSISDQDHFRLLCLVRRKRKTRFHPFPSYRRTEYRFHDVLLPGQEENCAESLLPSTDSHGPREFTTTGSIRDRVDGTLSIPIDPAEVELGGAASTSKQWHIKLEKKHILVPKLEALKEERKINTKHTFIEQLRKARQNLYVIHETIETSEEARYEESTEAEAKFMAQLYAKFSAKGTTGSKQSITIPRGCTLAFRAIQLTIEDAAWGLNHLPEHKQPTFVADGSAHREVEALEKEVKEKCGVLSQLDDELNVIVVKSIKAVMRDRNLLEELTEKMETILDDPENCELTTQSPDLAALLSTLKASARCDLLGLTEAISYTLDAFNELTEAQLLLLLESWDEKIVPQQLKVVRSILQQNRESSNAAGLLSSFSEQQQQHLTAAELELSGVQLQGNCKELSFPSLAALYAALHALHCLHCTAP
ncbi:gasdermin-A isoform X2 [Coturnix japonica]|uniref:gasdermin-A isoform X2 n=1 Tax=Coturnix japonica TaxID=93934 RepID=UPI000777BA9C|nr:gasdermin-A isoform X2 [Coturnix japonica]